MCLSGGFPLHKWATNNPSMFHGLTIDLSSSLDTLNIQESLSIPTLGLIWHPSDDTFHFTPTHSSCSKSTKRTILSMIAKLFDPLGLVSPVILQAKIILQQLWTLKLAWDDPLPPDLAQQWNSFVSQMSVLASLRVPRWLGMAVNASIQVHGFSDASTVGLAAVIYLRISVNNSTRASLLCAKSKVAPLKRQTIPRLELTAALILARLTALILKTLNLSTFPIYLWIDSSIVHTWVTNHPSKWKEYVRNRINLIHELVPQACWKLVPGEDNPSDCASRGLSPSELASHSMWWNGPLWLTQDQVNWPNSTPSCEESNLEKYVVTNTNVIQQQMVFEPITSRFSNLTRLLRVITICHRALIKRSFRGCAVSLITPEELESAKYICIRQSQDLSFNKEIAIVSYDAYMNSTFFRNFKNKCS